jgi:DNA-binding XRE family transcriptional regulator
VKYTEEASDVTQHVIIKDKRGRPVAAVVPWDEYRMAFDDIDEDDALIALGRGNPDEARLPSTVIRDIVLEKRNRIAAIRGWRGLTQKALAAAVDSQAAYISQIETGKAEAGRKMLIKLAKALKVTVGDLVGE